MTYSFADLVRLHQEGNLTQAKIGYLDLLAEQKTPEILQALGVLCLEEQNPEEALNYFKEAISLEPDSPVHLLNLSNAYKVLQRYDEAILTLQQALSIQPMYAAAANNLGTLYHLQGNYTAAIEQYKKAIEFEEDFIEAYYNLGLAHLKTQEYLLAQNTFLSITMRAENFSPAYFQLGNICFLQNNFSQAQTYYLKFIQYHPHHLESLINIAHCALTEKDYVTARKFYLRALEISSADTDILFNLAVVEMYLGQIDIAIQIYQRVLDQNPDHFAAHNNLGVAFLQKHHILFALQHFKSALRLQPDNEAIRYLTQSLVQDKSLLAAPTDYIEKLFDAYADHYEMHLQKSLQYQIPQLLHELVLSLIKTRPIHWDILDLGCGTGLSGVPFAPLAKTLIGIDLSEKMLALAKAKNIYTQLIHADILQGLQQITDEFDLVIAADVFVYIGDLKAIFAAVNKVLRPKGLFIFTTEITDEDSHAVHQSGRFAHAKEYLDELATSQGFTVAYYKVAPTRTQNGEPVYGHIYVLQR